LSVVFRPSDAASALVEALNAVTDCVTEQRLYVLPPRLESGVVSGLSFGRGDLPISLRSKAGGPSGLMLDIGHWFAIETDHAAERGSGWRVATVAYEYRILDARETELLVYHWQPGAIALGPDFPHLHVSAALTARTPAGIDQRFPLDKRHVPTGIVTLADVVRMLIAEFGIAERRRDWPARLARADRAIRRTCAWPDPAGHE
jgi:hypothetical protein